MRNSEFRIKNSESVIWMSVSGGGWLVHEGCTVPTLLPDRELTTAFIRHWRRQWFVCGRHLLRELTAAFICHWQRQQFVFQGRQGAHLRMRFFWRKEKAMVTKIEEIRKYGGAQEVELSGWNGDTVTMMLRRPSLYQMAAAGQIPNPLLSVAESLFMASGSGIMKADFLDTAKMMDTLARAVLVEPTYDELAEAGVALTDMQYNEIYAFVLRGPAGLARFRKAVRRAAGEHVADTEREAVEPAEH